MYDRLLSDLKFVLMCSIDKFQTKFLEKRRIGLAYFLTYGLNTSFLIHLTDEGVAVSCLIRSMRGQQWSKTSFLHIRYDFMPAAASGSLMPVFYSVLYHVEG